MKTTMILISIAVLALVLRFLVPAGSSEPQGLALTRTPFPFLIDQAPSYSWRLPDVLREISGLAAISATEVLAHNDELGIVYRIDVMTGEIDEWLQLDDPPLARDFEGIAVFDAAIALIDSKGRLVLIKNGLNRKQIVSDYSSTKTGLKDICEVEGLETGAVAGTLVIACKAMNTSGADAVAIYQYDINTQNLTRLTQIAFADVGEKIHPSGVASLDDGYLVVAARDRLLLWIDGDGTIRSMTKLGKKQHPQAEGIAVVADHLVIADEGGYLSVYPPGVGN